MHSPINQSIHHQSYRTNQTMPDHAHAMRCNAQAMRIALNNKEKRNENEKKAQPNPILNAPHPSTHNNETMKETKNEATAAHPPTTTASLAQAAKASSHACKKKPVKEARQRRPPPEGYPKRREGGSIRERAEPRESSPSPTTQETTTNTSLKTVVATSAHLRRVNRLHRRDSMALGNVAVADIVGDARVLADDLVVKLLELANLLVQAGHLSLAATLGLLSSMLRTWPPRSVPSGPSARSYGGGALPPLCRNEYSSASSCATRAFQCSHSLIRSAMRGLSLVLASCASICAYWLRRFFSSIR
ncbi:uncharacterized protein K452DRAFT_138253 [Aplosporella prunicola CBS 121167]|uniref:Uncharacterized protein n=1 Tax=Aplosporella prunicola CBS 121167 TaxID=1176127 RepID=A0A6A6AYE0_9PEZI|nr:uncharacterized protein K452DRAFT_139090 [Aplosporella prunicola CBS 121167]XP_033392068.1 uncharacterized protein K452DRAFT_138253 [Aplosporella prunicola CBS 121167]KAF2136268.1 hypothetical protein K452DRAFT_139090 [Aplosporella prunicola CBS 121167]KAF2136350.1 hypothetical protein K452DRAFT_138253 [Aplosporella prunicola CBS 121167]